MDDSQSVTITDFQPGDEQAVLSFCRLIFIEKGWPLRFLDSSIEDVFNTSGDVFLVAKAGDQLVGCGGLKKLSEEEALLTRMFVAKPWRGTGLGSKLFETLTKRAHGEGYRRIVLDVARDNARAIRFYESKGMEEYTPTSHPRWLESAPGEYAYVRYFRKKV